METVEHEAPAAIGHNSGSVLEMIENDPGAIYDSPGLLDDLLAEIRKQIDEREVDLTTKKGREAVTGLSSSISRRKASIEEAGKARTEEWRKRTAAVNAIKKRAEDELGTLRDLARAPLNKWEKEQKERDDRIAAQIEWLDRAGNIPVGASLADVDKALEGLARAKEQITEENFGEFTARALNAYRKAHDTLSEARPRIEKDEADRAELAALRAEREAEEKAKREAEAARLREEQEKLVAESAAARAKEEAERERLRAEAAQKAEADRRARDFENRERVKGEILDALTTGHGLVGSRASASRIFEAIAEGKIPHVTIEF